MKFAPYAKALVGAAIAGLTAAGTALTDGQIEPSEWIAIAVAALTALGVVYAVPNKDSGNDPFPDDVNDADDPGDEVVEGL